MLRGEGDGRNPPRGSPTMRGGLLDKIRRIVPDEGLPNFRCVTSAALAGLGREADQGRRAQHGG